MFSYGIECRHRLSLALWPIRQLHRTKISSTSNPYSITMTPPNRERKAQKCSPHASPVMRCSSKSYPLSGGGAEVRGGDMDNHSPRPRPSYPTLCVCGLFTVYGASEHLRVRLTAYRHMCTHSSRGAGLFQSQPTGRSSSPQSRASKPTAPPPRQCFWTQRRRKQLCDARPSTFARSGHCHTGERRPRSP